MLFVVSMLCFVVSAVLSLIFAPKKALVRTITGWGASIGSLCALAYALPLLFSGSTQSFSFPTVFPLFHITFFVDRLAALFICIIAIVALPASIYGISYLKKYEKYNIGVFSFFYNLFIISLFLVVTAYSGIYFLFLWELMSLTSLVLVFFEFDKPEVVSAGSVYFIMTHAAGACLLFAFLLLYGITGSFDFAVIKTHAHTLPYLAEIATFVLFVIGFGTKAGMIPLHIWLPKAHGAAPSHISALMSGVMIKMGIFMLMRMFLDILVPSNVWFGVVILVIGAISSILGVLYALAEHNIKRLLAFHSIENIGIILLGMGSGMIFLSLHQVSFAILAITAALFHTVNHAIFKSLLFLGAGAVINQTHTKNMEEYGGLIKKMPYTSLFFLIGSIAIAGLPPLNGFVSEWLTFQGLFHGILLSIGSVEKGVFIFGTAMLVFTGGLAAACFVKAFGTVFLARPRSEESKLAKEVSFGMVVSMGFLATLCVVLSIGAGFMIRMLLGVTTNLGLVDKTHQLKLTTLSFHVGNNFSALHMPQVMIGLLLTCLFAMGVTMLSRHQKQIRNILWSCGYTELTERMEITATGFSRSLILIFKGVFNPSKQDIVTRDATNSRYFSKSRTITLSVTNAYEKHIYAPLHKGVLAMSKTTHHVQRGNIGQYLLYIFMTLIGLLVFIHYS